MRAACNERHGVKDTPVTIRPTLQSAAEIRLRRSPFSDLAVNNGRTTRHVRPDSTLMASAGRTENRIMQAIFPGSSKNANPRADAPNTDEETAGACRALARAANEHNVCIRIAITANGGIEPFVLHVADSLRPGTDAYDRERTDRTLSEALEDAGIGYEELLRRLARSGRDATPNVPPPVIWSEPGLVVGGFAKGFTEEWRKLKDQAARA